MSLITEPGVYDLTEDDYHADPVPDGSLSSSGAKLLLPPSCPALFQWRLTNPEPPKDIFDFGSAAHAKVLGAGRPVVVIDADSWRTKAAQEARDEARAAGQIPLLPSDAATVDAMAVALRAHPIASALLDPSRGQPEQSLFWTDEATGVTKRARLDFLPKTNGERMLLADYKTTISAAPSSFAKSAGSFGYHVQAAWYIDAVKALGLAEEVAFLLVAQEKTAPYLVSVFELDTEALSVGAHLAEKATRTYAECKAAGTWPGYGDDITSISLPPWTLTAALGV